MDEPSDYDTALEARLRLTLLKTVKAYESGDIVGTQRAYNEWFLLSRNEQFEQYEAALAWISALLTLLPNVALDNLIETSEAEVAAL